MIKPPGPNSVPPLIGKSKIVDGYLYNDPSATESTESTERDFCIYYHPL